MTGYLTQHGFAYRFDWGHDGLQALAPVSDVVVIVDVLRFTTAVSAAVEAGAEVLPYPWDDDSAPAYAAANGAVLASRHDRTRPTLSPTDLLRLRAGTRLVLPSPNGSALSFAARDLGVPAVVAGCLRNAAATARVARRLAAGGVISVIAAGERWNRADGPLRPAVEDLLGAGAVLAALDPSAAVSAPRCSPEAAAARAAFVAARPTLLDGLRDAVSGRELVDRFGWDDDIRTASDLDATDLAAVLRGSVFVGVAD